MERKALYVRALLPLFERSVGLSANTALTLYGIGSVDTLKSGVEYETLIKTGRTAGDLLRCVHGFCITLWVMDQYKCSDYPDIIALGLSLSRPDYAYLSVLCVCVPIQKEVVTGFNPQNTLVYI